LQYEQEGYKELAKKLPNIGEEIEVEGEKATVVNCNVLKQTVDARFKNHSNGENHGDTVMEVDIENYTKKEK
jgi:cell fate regulator YaaT (PSP1 superfamily)